MLRRENSLILLSALEIALGKLRFPQGGKSMKVPGISESEGREVQNSDAGHCGMLVARHHK